MNIFILVGEALYGEQWVSPLARDLNINRKSLQRYVSGEREANPNLYKDMLLLLVNKQKQVEIAHNQVNTLITEYENRTMIFENNTLKIELKASDFKNKNTLAENAVITTDLEGFRLFSIKPKYNTSVDAFVLEVLYYALNKNKQEILKTSIFNLQGKLSEDEMSEALDWIDIVIGTYNPNSESSGEPAIIRVFQVDENSVIPHHKDFRNVLNDAVPYELRDKLSMKFYLGFTGALYKKFGRDMKLIGFDTKFNNPQLN